MTMIASVFMLLAAIYLLDYAGTRQRAVNKQRQLGRWLSASALEYKYSIVKPVCIYTSIALLSISAWLIAGQVWKELFTPLTRLVG